MGSVTEENSPVAEQPIDLTVEFETAPNNVEAAEPRLSWRVETTCRGANQSAYQILVARTSARLDDDIGGVWDSGRVESSNSRVTYDGLPLAPDETYHWKVRVWNHQNKRSEFSAPATFSTALAEASDWEGDWISHQPGAGDSNGYRSQWSRAGENGDEWVQVDLGSEQNVTEVELYPTDPFDGPTTPDGAVVSPLHSTNPVGDPPITEDGASGFGFPVRYRIEVADEPEFSKSRTVVDRTDGAQENPGDQPQTFDLDSVSARYVRVVATDLYKFDPADAPQLGRPQIDPERIREERQPWQVFALAALTVRDRDGEDLAAGCPVTASSSFEDETWGRRALVNGELESHVAATSPLLRTDLELQKNVRRARVHLAAVGYGELYINGKRVGDEVLNPAWTQYDQRVLYATHDVSDYFQEGDNALGIWLGRGWFSKNFYDWTGFGSPRALLQLSIEYEDGTTRTVSSDTSWRASASPILANDIYDGETYDARREQAGWASPGFDDEHWDAAVRMTSPGGDIRPQRVEPIRVVQSRDPVEVHEREDCVIFDFGQNMTGWIEVTSDSLNRGDTMDVAYAEALTEAGDLSMEDLRSAEATDTYIARGDSQETYEPRFTYHGFRYVRVAGAEEVSSENVLAKVVHTDMERSGSFECSNEDLNAVQHAAVWGLRGNAHGIPTDCPQRDERFGWTGDGQLATRALLYNFDAVRFHEKWMRDHDDAQSPHGYLPDTVPHGFGTIPSDPAWTVTRVVIPWYLYQFYGDRRVLETHYENMRRYVEYWDSVAENHVIPAEYGNYGDWLSFERSDERRGEPFDLFNTAYHYRTTKLVGKIAGEVGNEADAERYRVRADAIADAFNDRFFDAESATYSPRIQAAYSFPLHLGIVPDEHEDAVVETLVEKIRTEDDSRLLCGFLGARMLVLTLADHGYADLAYEMVSQPEKPGWVYMVRNGATTLWERWDSDDQVGSGMNSLNHSPFTYITEWFYQVLAGITINESRTDVGSIDVEPAFVDELDRVAASVETSQGTVTSRWEQTSDGFDLVVRIPWNTTATICIPIRVKEVQTADGVLLANNSGSGLPDGIQSVLERSERLEITAGAGTYHLELMI